MGRKIFVLFIGFLWSLGAYGIVGPIPTPIPEDHPGSYNAIALVKKLSSDKYQIFCSAFIFDATTVVTAKHCVAERAIGSYAVYLGPDTNRMNPEQLIQVSEAQVYGPQDWQSYFPSFDVAVIKLANAIPGFGDPTAENYYDTVPFLTDPELLKSAEAFHLVGYGNQSAELNEIVAGEKKHVATSLHRFVDTPQLSSLIVFQGEIGHSNCHGDSGGPAYAKIRDSKTGKSQWFVVGTAAGFDLALTPDSYKALDDEDFPFVAKCDQSQTIYSFIGDYTSWIESNSNSKASRLGASRDLPPGQFAETVSDAKTFSWYCKNVEFADPRWGAVRELMIAATEIESEFSSSDVFTDCDLAEAILDKVEFIQLDEISYVDDLEPFSALPNLKRLSVKDIEMPDFSSLDSESLVELRLQNVSGLKNLSFLQTFPSADQLRALEVRSSKLASSSGISNASSLRELVLGDNELKFLTEIEELSMLETLNVSSNDIYELFGLAGLKHLAKLNAHGNALVALPPLPAAVELNISGNQISSLEFLRDSKALVSLSASGNTIVDLGPLYFSKHLTQLDVSNNPINLPISGIWLPTIEVLRLNSVSIRSLDFLSHSFSLKRLYIANTQVDSLQPLAGLPNLKTLFAGGTPVSKLKDPDSDLCPIDAKNAVSGFCKRLTANSKLSPNVRWRFM